MDLERMLANCHRDQWRVDDLDWTVPAKAFSPEDEMLIVQYFTDMALLELIAAELFCMQRERTEDPTLRAIFESFIVDEIRHSRVAERLADHYDVHHYRRYHRNPNLSAYSRHFAIACRAFSPEIASSYTTHGELILDVAMLRSIDDFVDDELSRSAMRLINRDESRHIAIDFYLVERYALKPEEGRANTPRLSWKERAAAARAFAGLLYYAAPVFTEIFVNPLQRVDPSGHRLQEALRRSQVLMAKPHVAQRPLARYLNVFADLMEKPAVYATFGKLLTRFMGLDPRVMDLFYTGEEASRVARDEATQLPASA